MKVSEQRVKTDRYALVTGASDRIGKAIALELAEMGYHLVLHYRSSLAKIEQVKQQIEGIGRKAVLVQFDFLADNDFNKVFDDLKSKNIMIEVMINSASDFSPSNYTNKGSLMLGRQMKINFEGAYSLTKVFYQIYGKGIVINLLDTKINKNHTMHLDYILAKKLLAEFTKISALELAPHIRVNGICPGLILPPKGKGEQYLKELAEHIPLKQIGSLEDIQRAVRFLVEMSFITGQLLFIDGGEHLSS